VNGDATAVLGDGGILDSPECWTTAAAGIEVLAVVVDLINTKVRSEGLLL
jgi:hypothetical protein